MEKEPMGGWGGRGRREDSEKGLFFEKEEDEAYWG